MHTWLSAAWEGLGVVNFKRFGRALILTSPGAGEHRECSEMFMEPSHKRLHPRIWSTFCLLCSKADTEPEPQVRLPWLPLSAPSWPSLPFSIPPYIEIFLFSSCLLYALAFYTCHLMAELFMHSIVFFLTLLKLLLLTDPSLGPLVPDHLCALPVKMLPWAHYQFTWPNDFLSWVPCSDTPVLHSRPHWGCCHLGCLFLGTLQHFPPTRCLQSFPRMDLTRISQQAL